jgi:dienelactone hydrolase
MTTLRIAIAALLAVAGVSAAEDLAARMVDGIHRYLDRATLEAAARRPKPSEASRDRLCRLIGAVDERVGGAPEIAADGHTVRWPVFAGVTAEGLAITPRGAPACRAVVLPEADAQPEESPLVRLLAARGCQVLAPVLIDRKDTWSGNPSLRMTNQPHREWIWRMSWEVGRTIVGYEVQKTLAAVDWFRRQGSQPIVVAGEGEGGLIAFYSAAIDTRIDAAIVAGYFGPREGLWSEPIYRDVWGLLREFGDAEIAALIAPRKLVVVTKGYPEIAGPPPATKERAGACPNGRLTAPPLDEIRREAARMGNAQLAASLDEAVSAVVKARARPVTVPAASNAETRSRRQFDELVEFTQKLVRLSPVRRAEFARRPAAEYRDYIWSEVIGRLPDPSLPPNPRLRQIFDEPKFRGYEVVLDVWPEVFAAGILLVPKDLAAGERRPVVVCQHGLEGRPRDLADPRVDNPAYHRYGVRLAEEGFVVYAPQNPYIGMDRFRLLLRKARPLKLSLFSFILGQHQQTLAWLKSLDYVDGSRIGFYGLSYGGKTAVRVPPLLDGYALSICSADFNEWVWKTTSVEDRYSYMFTQEYDMYEWNFANVVNYGELAALMAPRPFMVERGHDDGVAPDEWVAYEFAKVRRFYNKAGIGDRARIEFFDGPHTIHGVGTFEFLRRFLKRSN